MSLQIAIVGSGPAGCFLAELLTRKLPDCQLDIIERLPTLFGLVRAGVAPDHQGTKNVTRQFERTLQKENIRVLANLTVGKDISYDELKACYDLIIFATGASEDNTLGIDNESLDGVYGSGRFVGWYNGDPDAHQQALQLAGPSVAIIGHGNVALDIARLLAKSPDERVGADICQPALDQLNACTIKDIYLIGRSGPEQARFTPPELAELKELTQALPVTTAAIPTEASPELEPRERRAKQMNLELFQQFALNTEAAATRPTRIHLLFNHQPKALQGEAGRVTQLELMQRTPGSPEQPVTLPVNTLISAIGYRSRPIGNLPFDSEAGRFTHQNGLVEAGVYLTGWCRRGPTGVIPTNRADALEISKRILNDLESGAITAGKPGGSALDSLIAERSINIVHYQDWQRIDQAEIAAATAPKTREPFTSVASMLHCLEQ